MADAEDRTEAASAKRLQRAREQGNVPISREAASFAPLAAAGLVLIAAGAQTALDLTRALRPFLSFGAAGFDPDQFPEALWLAVKAGLVGAAPLFAATILFSVTAGLLQSGFLFRPAALQPDLARLDPRRGLKRLFGLETLAETGKGIGKIALLGALFWPFLSSAAEEAGSASFWNAEFLTSQIVRQVTHVLLLVLGAQGAIAALDLFWVRLKHARSLRMSRDDLREEHKESEGDPRIKHRIKKIRFARARKRMLAAVPKATVVVTNPTHYAIALAYDRAKNAAPRVVAKGVDLIAARIREVAEESKVPLVSNPPLARALYQVELDTEIPAEHYQAVAEIIAYVWNLTRRRPGVL
ncbi:MAG: flagellar biosynthesis protein FlhB [Acetobacteraceae bacterium]|nr:flagellar biosynthesis protein FlhB [Acetobacteraceae bacterium]